MESERRFAALASVGLFVSMFLPWYQQNGFVKTGNQLESRNLDAFQVFSFVEAAVLLVAVALIYMLYARAEGREFKVPGGDGTIVLIAGAWVGAMLVFRLFDKPGISSRGVAANVGVQWGIFFALAAAGLIAYSGSRMRGAHAGPRLRAAPDAHARPARRERQHTTAEPPADIQRADPDAPGGQSEHEARAERTPETRPTQVVAPRRPPAATPAGASRPAPLSTAPRALPGGRAAVL